METADRQPLDPRRQDASKDAVETAIDHSKEPHRTWESVVSSGSRWWSTSTDDPKDPDHNEAAIPA
jgi:hypothetical protein